MSTCASCRDQGTLEEFIDDGGILLCAGCYRVANKQAVVPCFNCHEPVNINDALHPNGTSNNWCWHCFKGMFLTNLKRND